MSDLHTTPLGTAFAHPVPEVAAWMRPAIEPLAAVRSGDDALIDEVLATHAAEPVDLACGLAIVGTRLFGELGDAGDWWLADLGLEVARQGGP